MSDNKGCLFTTPVIGVIMVLMMMPMLFWNEGRAVNTYRSLVEGAGAVISASANRVDAANEGRLVHITGRATTDQSIRDPIFEVTEEKILRLKRTAEMYQWHEKRESKGSGSEKRTEYSYYKDWSSTSINSSRFNQSGYSNPPMPYESELFNAETVMVDAFILPPTMLNQMDDFQQIPVEKVPELSTSFKIVQHSYFYTGEDETNPQIGDLKISFGVIRPGEVSIVAQQTGHSFQPYKTDYYPVELFEPGTHTAQAMFDTAQSENTFLTWMLRCAGFMGIFIGLMMIVKPLSSLLEYVPILGDMANAGIAIFAFGVSFGLAFTVMAIGWIAYRPLLGCTLLIVAVAGLGGAWFGVQKFQQPSSN